MKLYEKKTTHVVAAQLSFHLNKSASIRCPGWGPCWAVHFLFYISHFPFAHSHSCLHKRPLLQSVVVWVDQLLGGCFSGFLVSYIYFYLGWAAAGLKHRVIVIWCVMWWLS